MRKLALLAALLAVAVFGLVAATGTAKKGSKAKTFTATLTGKTEVPGPGDPDGRGSAVIKFRGSRICYDIKVRRINGVAAAHIHTGAKGVAGDVLVGLVSEATTNRRLKGCVTVPNLAEVRSTIRANPRGFYVNVHNADYPNGAIRGQLKRHK